MTNACAEVGASTSDEHHPVPATRAAIERLIEVARHDTHQARHCANFLLAWWNAEELGGFDLTELWALDGELRDAMVLVFAFIAHHHVYPSEYAFRSEIEELIRLWRPRVGAAV